MSRKVVSLPWLIASVAVFFALLGLSSLGLEGGNRYTLFAGRFHPLILHLPIGALIAAFVLEALAFLRPRLELGSGIVTLLGIAALTALPAALCGILLSWDGGYNERLLGRHLWLGTFATSASFLLIALRLPAGRKRPSLLYGVSLGTSVFLLGLTGHYGGALTHGEGYLSRHWPFGQGGDTAIATAAIVSEEPASVYEERIQPIFDNYCVQCHGPEKSKGDFRLDTYDLLMASGERGPVVTPGDSFQSLLVEQLKLPIDHEERMPPKGKSQPSSQDIQLLSWWIDQGANPHAEVEELAVTPRIARILNPDTDIDETIADRELPAPKHWNVIREEVGRIGAAHRLEILPLSASDHRLRVRSSISSSRITDDALAALAPVGEQIVWLDASNADIGPRGMQAIGRMANLERIHFNDANVTDELLVGLQSLQKLNYLNLVGTNITDEGLRILENLPALRKVYLWQTQATAEGAERLQAQLYDSALAEELLMQQSELAERLRSLQVVIDRGVTSEHP